MKYIAVKNFLKYQHYSDRTPPWIKFYNSILDDYDFLQLSDASRSHLLLMWLLASRTKDRIPYDVKYITGAIKARGKIDFDALFASGMIYLADSTDAEQHSTDASISGDVEEKRGEKKRKEGEETAPPKAVKREAGKAFAAIRALVREHETPGNGRSRFIAAAEVESLGALVWTAYERVGGAARFLDQKERVGFLSRDFEAAYAAATDA